MRRFLALVLLVGVGAPGPLLAQEAPTATAFVHVSVIPMDRNQVLTDQTVVIQDGRITALGPAGKVRVPAKAVQVDGQGKFLLPGLADMQTFLQQTGGVTQAERTLFLLLANGVTTVYNTDGFSNAQGRMLDGPSLLRLRARVATGELVGPRLYTSGAWQLDHTKSVDANVEAYKAAGYDFLTTVIETKDTTETKFAAARLDSLVTVARRVGLPIGPAAMGLPLAGYSWTEFGMLLGFAEQDSTKLAERLATIPAEVARAQVWTCLCRGTLGGWTQPTALQRRYGLIEEVTPDSSPAARRELHIQAQLLKALRGAGGGLLLGSGTPIVQSLTGFGVHHTLQALVQLGFTPYEALEVGTRNAAVYLGKLDSTGTVTVGKRADLVLLTGNPLEDIRRSSDIAGVMAAGRWLPQAELEQRLAVYYPDAPKGR